MDQGLNSDTIAPWKRFSPWLVAAGAMLLNLLAWHYTTREIKLREKEELQSLSQQLEHEISFRLETYINALVQTQSMFEITTEPDVEHFKSYVSRLNFLTQTPGAQGIGYSKRVPKSKIGAYKVWPTFDREEYFVIVYIEPMDWRSERAIGYDMFTDPTRRLAMETARDIGKAVMTEKVILVKENIREHQAGFLIYVPVYDTTDLPTSVEGRRRALKGYIYSPFRTKELFTSIMSDLKRPADLGLKVFMNSIKPDNLLFDSTAQSTSTVDVDTFSSISKLKIAEKDLFIETYALSTRRRHAKELPILLLIMGSFISIVLFLMIRKEQRHAQDLEDALKARDEFISIASHELKTPVTSLSLQFQMAQRMIDRNDPKVNEPESVQKRVTNARTQLTRISKLVDDMLETSRVSLNKLKLEHQRFDVNQLIREIISSHQEQINDYKVEVHLDLTMGELEMVGDRFRLEQVFINLLTNSLKYGNGKPVEIFTKRHPQTVEVTFKDEGIGIPPEATGRIFHRFERAVSGTSIRGLGLGLYISNEIVSAHHGRIEVKSELEKGSSFTVILPRVR